MSKEISIKHYEYANNLVKLVGFKNLKDFNTILTYSVISNDENILKNVNATMNDFKKIFELQKFDLARLNYQFKTFEQFFGFFKKLLSYLDILYDVYKNSKGDVLIRLKQQNLIYKKYIDMTTEIGNTTSLVQEQIENARLSLQSDINDKKFLTEDEINKLQPTIHTETIYNTYKSYQYKNNYILLNDRNIKEFVIPHDGNIISNIEIFYSNENEDLITFEGNIEISIGGIQYLKLENDQKINTLIPWQYIPYHQINFRLLNLKEKYQFILFRITYDKLSDDCPNYNKYKINFNLNNLKMYAISGMVSSYETIDNVSKIYNNTNFLDKTIDTFTKMIDENDISITNLNIPCFDKPITLYNINITENNIKTKYKYDTQSMLGLSLLVNIPYIDPKFKDISTTPIATTDILMFKTNDYYFIKQEGDKLNIHYRICRNGDMLNEIIINIPSVIIKVYETFQGRTKYHGTVNQLSNNLILKHEIPLINRQDNDVYLVFEINKKDLSKFIDNDFFIRYIFLDTNERRKLAQSDYLNII